MDGVPLIGRLSLREYLALIFGFLVIGLETLLRLTIFCLPKPIIRWFYERSQALFHHFSRPTTQTSPEDKQRYERIRKASDFGELCRIYGYVHEEHVVLTKVSNHVSSQIIIPFVLCGVLAL